MLSLFLSILILLTSCGASIPSPPTKQTFSNANNSFKAPTPTADPAQAQEPSWLKIIVVDVGQGNATLIVTSDAKALLIDTGPPDTAAPKILQTAKDLGVQKIETIVLSHNHLDHTGGLDSLLKNPIAQGSTILDRDRARVGDILKMGAMEIDTLAVNGHVGLLNLSDKIHDDENSRSVAMLLKFGDFRYFTDGDLTGGGGEPPYQTGDFETALAPLVGHVDVLLAPHHGSNTGSNQTFVDTLNPDVVLFSFGDNNDYHHPHATTIDRYRKAHAKLYATEQGFLPATTDVHVVHGSICVVTDGRDYTVKPYAVDKCAPPATE